MADDTATDEVAPLAPYICQHLNDEHADSLLLVGQVFGARPDATATTAVGADGRGLDLVVQGPDGSTALRAEFAEAVTDVLGVRVQAVALVAQARERAGITEPTAAEQELARSRAIRTFVTSVVRTEQLTPHYRQITFGGGDLHDFSPLGPDTFLYVLAPPRGRSELTIDQGFSWETVGDLPEAERPIGAYYTLRRWRPEVAELDLIFLLHGDQGDGSWWAGQASPGDPVALWGPRTAWDPPTGTDRYLLVADETGLPALAVILETLPAGTPVTAFVELDDDADRIPFETSVDLDLTWLHRGGADVGTTTLLVDAVRAAGVEAAGTYAWGGGESRAVTAVRKHLRAERAFDREAVSMTGYWRHDRHAADEDGD